MGSGIKKDSIPKDGGSDGVKVDYAALGDFLGGDADLDEIWSQFDKGEHKVFFPFFAQANGKNKFFFLFVCLLFSLSFFLSLSVFFFTFSSGFMRWKWNNRCRRV